MKLGTLWTIIILGNLSFAVVYAVSDASADGKIRARIENFQSRHTIKYLQRIFQEHKRRKRFKTNEFFHLKISFLYEKSREETWELNKNTIKEALKIVNKIFKRAKVKVAVQGFQELKHEDFFASEISTDLLQTFLQYKQEFVNHRLVSDNTQLVVSRHPGLGHELVGAATFQSVCSPDNSVGIILETKQNTNHLALIMAHNLACSVGIFKKEFCFRGFREKDIVCMHERKSLTTDQLTKCVWEKIGVDFKRYNLKAVCERNRARKLIPKRNRFKIADEKRDDKGSSKMVVILSPPGGALLVLIVVLAVYKWNKDRHKTKFLKDRVAVEYKAMTQTPTRPSLVNDPTVNYL